MRRASPPLQERVQLDFDLVTVKELLRDLLFREAGQAYFKRLAVPRQRRWLGAWRTLSTYQAEKQLLPVGGRDTNRLIQQFFTTHACLRAEFHEGGMPVTAIRVLRLHCPALNAALERIHCLECAAAAQDVYHVLLLGGPAPPSRALYSPHASSKALTRRGTHAAQSATIPISASAKMGACASELIATMVPEA